MPKPPRKTPPITHWPKAAEILCDIARTIGERRLTREGDTRDDFPDFRGWAEDFQALYDANPNACDTYYIDVEEYALKRAKEAGFTPCKDPDHAKTN